MKEFISYCSTHWYRKHVGICTYILNGILYVCCIWFILYVYCTYVVCGLLYIVCILYICWYRKHVGICMYIEGSNIILNHVNDSARFWAIKSQNLQ